VGRVRFGVDTGRGLGAVEFTGGAATPAATFPPVVARTVEELYAEGPLDGDEIDRLLDTSLDPRGPDLLFDLAEELGLGAGWTVLDVGCRDGAQLVELHRRTGCAGVGLEPVAANLARASADDIAPAPIRLVRGVAEAMPFADTTFDLVWVRDVLVHVAPLARALRECRRVLRPGAPMLVFQMFATSWLEPGETERLWPDLAVVPANADRQRFEQAIGDAGLVIEHRDDLRSEWREQDEEQGDRRTSRQLLWAARLLRDPERFRAALGEADYDAELANCLWGVYQMIGKLSPAVYVLR
jgi:SAM-dependent methyltransferase